MATSAEWATGYARQADADFQTYEKIQALPVPECHKLQFLQMACEKLVKAHLCGRGTDPATLQGSHAYIANNLPVVLRQQAVVIHFTGGKARAALNHARHLAQEIDALAPAVRRAAASGRTIASIPGKTRAGHSMSPWTGRSNLPNSSLDPQAARS